MKCSGLHCQGCGSHGGNGGHGGGWALLALVLAAVAVAAARPAMRAADTALRVLVTVLEIAGLVLASVAGVAVLAACGVAVVRVQRHVLAQRERARQLAARAPAVMALDLKHPDAPAVTGWAAPPELDRAPAPARVIRLGSWERGTRR